MYMYHHTTVCKLNKINLFLLSEMTTDFPEGICLAEGFHFCCIYVNDIGSVKELRDVPTSPFRFSACKSESNICLHSDITFCRLSSSMCSHVALNLNSSSSHFNFILEGHESSCFGLHDGKKIPIACVNSRADVVALPY